MLRCMMCVYYSVPCKWYCLSCVIRYVQCFGLLCMLFVVWYIHRVVCLPLCVDWCGMSGVRCLLLFIVCHVFVVRGVVLRLLFYIQCMMFAVLCMPFDVCWLLIGV